MPDFLTEYFTGFTESLFSTLQTPDAYLNKTALTAAAVIISLLAQFVLKKIITNNVKDFKKRLKLRKVAKSAVSTLTILFVLFIWIQAINALILIALTVGVFIAFMVKGLTTNIIGYFVIKYRKYFEIGHRVEINNIIGDVIDINPTNFKLLESRNWLSSDANTGRIIKLPNSLIFEESIEMIGVKNTFIWHEVKYLLAFDSNWRKAEQIMIEIGEEYFVESVLPGLEETNERLPSAQTEFQPVFSLDTTNEGIIVNLRYLVDYRKGTSVKTALQKKILTRFEDHPDILFATVDVRLFPD